jgi:hypothetical protein
VCLTWVDDLVATDPDVHHAALTRFRQSEEARADFQARFQDLSNEIGTGDPNQLKYRKRLHRMAEERAVIEAGSLMHQLVMGWLHERVDRGDLVHYALRYLEWESRYPAEWQKNWHLKRKLLWQLSRSSMCARHRAMAADVVVLAANRTQHCEDDRYVLLADAIDSDDLRARLTEVGNDRARFLLYMLDHHELGATSYSWQTWLTA